MPSLAKLTENRSAKPVLIVVSVAAVIAAFVLLRGAFTSPAATIANERTFVDGATGKGFSHELVVGESVPVQAPSGGKTGYPAELCYWTKDGNIKSDPTPVLLNIYLGKTDPTFCPDCGRLVVGRNPYPSPGSKPPPTREEYEQRVANP